MQLHVYEGSAEVANLRSVHLTLQAPPELGPFRPLYVTVPSDVAPHFLVTDVKIGRDSQFLSIACVPACLFDESQFPVHLRFNLLHPYTFLTISVTNISTSPRMFRFKVVGTHDASTEPPTTVVLGLGNTLISPSSQEPSPKFTLRVQPAMVYRHAFVPRFLSVPTDVLRDFRLDALGKHPAYATPPSPGDLRLPPVTPADSPLTSETDPAQFGREQLLIGNSSIFTVELRPDPAVKNSDFVVLRGTLTTEHASSFRGAIVGDLTCQPEKATEDLRG